MGRHITCITLILSWAWVASAHSQQIATTITPTAGAGDLGTKVTQAGNSSDINGGTRPSNGPNLFHSFDQFSLGRGDIANFANDTGLATQNILSRVTGGSRSDIFGTIKTTGFPGADLFLLNPAGVVFGPSASLNVEGSFHVSTADFIKLADGMRFDALPSANDALLTTAPPAAFGFLSEHPAKISFVAEDREGESFGKTFFVPEGETLSIVGGDIEIQGGEGEIVLSGQEGFPVKNRLRAPGGRINLASLASPGEVKLDTTLKAESSGPRGTITMQGSTLDVSEAERGTTGGGKVFIRGGRFVVDDSAVLANTVNGDTGGIDIELAEALLVTNGGQIASLTTGPGNAGDVRIDAKKEIVLADARIAPDRTFNSSRLRTAARPPCVAGRCEGGTAGDIVLNTERLEIRDGAFISALTNGDGNGGVVTITAKDVVLKARFDPSLKSSDPERRDPDRLPAEVLATTAFGVGEGGKIVIDTERLRVSEGARLTSRTNGRGKGGNVEITASDSILLEERSEIEASSINFATNDAGNVIINTSRLWVTGGSEIVSETLGAVGNGGNVTINAKNEIVLADARIEPDRTFNSSTLRTEARLNTRGTAGDIVLNTERLEIRDGAFISALTKGDGNGGVVKITAKDVVLKARPDPSLKSSDPRRRAPDRLPAEVLATTDTGVGEGGKIVIDTGRLRLSEGARLTSRTNGPGKGGNVEITASDSVLLEGGSEIEASSIIAAKNDAGNITIHAGRLELKDGARIRAETFGPGAGGAIHINAINIDMLDGSRISSQSTSEARDAGASGSILVRALDSLRLFNDSHISVETEQAHAGDISLEVGFLLHLREQSSITTSVAPGTDGKGIGNGGDINIDPVFTVLDGGSQIIANALEGSAGNIRIRTDFLFRSPDSKIEASNGFGVEGNVEIDSPDTDVISSALELPESFLDAATLLTQGCAPGAELSRLVVRKYEVLPDSPAALRVPPPGGLLNADARNAFTGEALWSGAEHLSACDGNR